MANDGKALQPHERLLELLGSAHAESCQVVATFLDIRGFSTFSASGDSFDSALYLRSLYKTILSSTFDDTDFFKPTGDGLLLIHELPNDADSLPAIVSSILARSANLVDTFGDVTSNDVMINFAVPQKLGVGVARGTVTRLVADGAVLDYTGRSLNLAARLMDKARPFGVVFADTHAKRLMTTDIEPLFEEDEVCIRGISEQQAMPIFVTRMVEISDADREPIAEAKHTWGDSVSLSLSEIRDLSTYSFYLPRPPRSYERCGVHVQYPLFDRDDKPKDTVSWLTIYGSFQEQPGGILVQVDLQSVKDQTKTMPATTTSKVLGWTKTTRVTFTPFCGPLDED